MWLNHLDREDKMSKSRSKKVQKTQDAIFQHPERYGNNYNNLGDIKKDHLIHESLHDNYGNSLITEMSGCPIQKVHKLKAKRREKLKKYLYQGSKNNGGYQYNKYKLQNGNNVSLEMTPDYYFKKALDAKKQTYHADIGKLSLSLIYLYS